MRKNFLLIIWILILSFATSAQLNFAEECLGKWKGTMFIYNRGELKEKVEVRLTVAKTSKVDDYVWKTEYLSPTRPVVKDYILRIKDIKKGSYIVDEGNGLELNSYLFEDKLYNVFEVQGAVLTSTYQIKKDKKELIFEVTSGRKINEIQGVSNFSVDVLQKVVFKKEKRDR